MKIENRVEKLESVVFSSDDSNISDAVMSLYGNIVQFQILMGDFFHDLAVTSSKLMEEIAQYIPEEIVQELQEHQERLRKEQTDDNNVVPFPTPDKA